MRRVYTSHLLFNFLSSGLGFYLRRKVLKNHFKPNILLLIYLEKPIVIHFYTLGIGLQQWNIQL